jgi:hypothetical protein
MLTSHWLFEGYYITRDGAGKAHPDRPQIAFADVRDYQMPRVASGRA